MRRLAPLSLLLLLACPGCGSGRAGSADGKGDQAAEVAADRVAEAVGELPPEMTAGDAADTDAAEGDGRGPEAMDAAELETGDLPAEMPVIPQQANIAADTNRDGAVTFDSADEEGEETWCAWQGAVFLVNADDDDGDHVRDADDETVNGPADLDDLAPLLIPAHPWIPAGTSGLVTVDAAAAGHVRLFVKEGETWSAAGADGPEIPFDLLSSQMTRLALEGIHFRGEAGFSGDATLTLTLRDAAGKTIGEDTTVLRAAPLILPPVLAVPSQVLAVKTSPSPLLDALPGLLQALGLNEMLIDPAALPGAGPADLWVQDAVELGFAARPAAGQAHVMTLAVPGLGGEPLDGVAKSLLLGPETGLAPVVQAGSDADLDDFSNLEVTPALLHEEQFHPYGRIVAGMDAQSGAAPSPELLALLAAQAAQGDAVLVDTSWLRSRHVDEIVGWIPFLGGPGCCGKGFVLLLPDTIRMLALLEEVAAAGHGDAVVLSGTEQETTVDALLANAALLDFNAGLQEKLDDLRTQLASELQLVDEDIVLLPALFAPFSDDDPAAVPLFPSPIAGVVVGKLLILPAPHGPEVDDSDALRVRVEELLAPYSVVLTFVDDLVPYHTAGGSLHRGTQVRRLPTNLEWWMNL